ncbi:hypothetical protein BLGI_1602 [Brevibacillus laterosporus GI-9]|nr:hypothetical protein BLGI_1602 [Brevibacillus laterosporus GI-9]
MKVDGFFVRDDWIFSKGGYFYIHSACAYFEYGDEHFHKSILDVDFMIR